MEEKKSENSKKDWRSPCPSLKKNEMTKSRREFYLRWLAALFFSCVALRLRIAQRKRDTRQFFFRGILNSNIVIPNQLLCDVKSSTHE